MPRRLGKHACDKGDGMQSPRQANPNPVPAAQTPYVDHMPSQASAGSAVAPRCGPPAQLPRTPPCARRPAPADPLHTRGFPPRWHLRAERPSTAPQASPPACSQSADPLHRPMRQTTVTGCNLKDRKPQSRGPLVPPYRVPRSSWSSSAELRPRSHLAARAVVLAALPRRVPYNWVQFSAHMRVPEPVTPQPRKLHPVSRRPADRSPVLTPPPSLEGSRRAASPGPSASPDHPLQPCADSSETSPLQNRFRCCLSKPLLPERRSACQNSPISTTRV